MDENQRKESSDRNDEWRIDSILAQVREIWIRHPELRLGQLINNAVEEPRLYYIADAKLIGEMNRFYDKLDAGK